MAIKKSQLYSTLWESCNALRGSMDASQYKDYVLMILFVKYLSDKSRQGESDLEVPPGCHFEDFVGLKQHAHIGEAINKKLEAIREANTPFIGDLSLPNFNDDAKLGAGRTKVETLSRLIGVFERDELDFSHNRAADDDLLGDAYEYLMKHFAAASGHKGGQFYTPTEVSRVLAAVLHLQDLTRGSDTIYDMTCGSGSLLLRALSETNGEPSLYGQEKDSTTASLAKLNMLLHGVSSANIKVGDTLNDPRHTEAGLLKTFDVCVANPPFSQAGWLAAGGESDPYQRWSAHMLPPPQCGDYAFLLHLVASMKADTGRGACILPHGVLFRGNKERDLRRGLVEKHLIKGIIGLPPELFFGASIPACIVVLDCRGRAEREGIFFIDAKEGYMKEGAKNRLREQDIRRILDAWDDQRPVPHYARLAPWQEIADNDYNLNIPRYVTPLDRTVRHDIERHLHGGLPRADIEALGDYWRACPTLRGELFSTDAAGLTHLAVAPERLADTVAGDESFRQQGDLFERYLRQWADEARPLMAAIGPGCQPKSLIKEWSGLLLARCRGGACLVDPYAVYDRLMTYWTETMQDDCYRVANDGWTLPADLRPAKKKGTCDDIQCDLLPPRIVVDAFFGAERDALEACRELAEASQSALDDHVEAQADTFDLLESVSEAAARRALKQGVGEAGVWQRYLDLAKAKKAAAKELSQRQTQLTELVLARYQELTGNEICRLVVDRKWIAEVMASCREELGALAQRLTSTVALLDKRYRHTLAELEDDARRNQDDVRHWLELMGFDFEEK